MKCEAGACHDDANDNKTIIGDDDDDDDDDDKSIIIKIIIMMHDANDNWVSGLGFGVEVQGLWFRVWGLGFRV